MIAMSFKKQRLGNKTVGKGKLNLGKWMRPVAGLALGIWAFGAQAAPTITDIEFSSRPGSKFEVRLDFNETPPDLKAYTIEKPARIAVDFPGTSSALEQKRYSLPYGNATGVVVLESGDRTRMVVNLVKLVPYETRVDGNSLFLVVGQDGSDYIKPTTDPNRLKTEITPVAEIGEFKYTPGHTSEALVHDYADLVYRRIAMPA